MVNAAKLYNETVRVFTFGLGSGCDVDLVTRTAQAGRGTCSLVKDNAHDLNGLVIRALQNAMQPSLSNCSTMWNDESKGLDEVFRDQSIISSKIMPKQEFAELNFIF